MKTTLADTNRALVLRAFETLFNKRDYTQAAAFWSPHYVQHSAYIGPGPEGVFDLIRSLPSTLKYENAVAIAQGDYVILHGRYSGHGLPRSWVTADIVLVKDGLLAEHWDVIQNEATELESKSGKPMFGETFATAEPVTEVIA